MSWQCPQYCASQPTDGVQACAEICPWSQPLAGGAPGGGEWDYRGNVVAGPSGNTGWAFGRIGIIMGLTLNIYREYKIK